MRAVAGFVGLERAEAAVVDRCRFLVLSSWFLEPGTRNQEPVGGPGVAAQLEGRARVFGDVDRRLFGLDEEGAAAADAEGVVRGFGCARDLD